MSDPFLGEVTCFAYNWAPKGYALCDGATLLITQNQALHSLLGTQFGGDGKTTFGLPDLRGRVPVGIGPLPGGSTYAQGQTGGAEIVALTMNTVPPHQHPLNAATDKGDVSAPTGALLATVWPASSSTQNLSSYKVSGWSADTALNAGSVKLAGGDLPHQTMQPFTVANYCIALHGNYPPRP